MCHPPRLLTLRPEDQAAVSHTNSAGRAQGGGPTPTSTHVHRKKDRAPVRPPQKSRQLAGVRLLTEVGVVLGLGVHAGADEVLHRLLDRLQSQRGQRGMGGKGTCMERGAARQLLRQACRAHTAHTQPCSAPARPHTGMLARSARRRCWRSANRERRNKSCSLNAQTKAALAPRDPRRTRMFTRPVRYRYWFSTSPWRFSSAIHSLRGQAGRQARRAALMIDLVKAESQARMKGGGREVGRGLQ